MVRKKLKTVEEVKTLRPEQGRPFFSAEHDEILRGETTDIYFVRTKQILDEMGLSDTRVTAEIFPRRPGVFAGAEEVVGLLEGQGVELWSLPEGASFEEKEVVMRVKGPYDHFGLYETVILGILASSSGWATAARQAKEAAGDKQVFCFGARHLHPAAAPVMERCAIIGGADGASCILGAKFAGQEPAGTLPHAFFLIVGDTVEGAEAYDRIMPPEALRLILVDTFRDEPEESLRVAESLGERLYGVRLDTPGERGGVTRELAQEVRYRLDAAGYEHVKIFVSGGLTPEKIRSLMDFADAFGVGSFISSAPPIDMTMDIKEVEGRPIAKRGRLPGILENPKLKKLL